MIINNSQSDTNTWSGLYNNYVSVERPDTADKEVYKIQKGEELRSQSSHESLDTSRSRLEQWVHVDSNY